MALKVCVVGAGAVGGYLAAMLLRHGGHQVCVMARGAQREAIARQGLTLLAGGESFVVHPHAVAERAGPLGEQDVVFVTVKAHSQPAAAPDIGQLLGTHGVAVFAGNGIPWWWPYRGKQGGAPATPANDPAAALWRHVGPRRTLGCVLYSANEVASPGVVRHTANNHWLLGEPDGSLTPRLAVVVDLLRAAKLDAEAVPDIRSRVWKKLLRNVPLNSVCALTRLPVDGIAGDAALQALCDSLVDEVAAIAMAEGTDLSTDVPQAKSAARAGAATDGSRALGIRPSMLQDVLGGRPMEVDAILGQVQAMARARATPCPTLDVILPLVRGLDRSRDPARPPT